MKTKYNFKNPAEVAAFKDNILYLLRRSFYSMRMFTDRTLKDSINTTAYIAEKTDEEKAAHRVAGSLQPYYLDYNFIWVQIPVKVNNLKELAAFTKKMEAQKFIFKEKPTFRVNYNPVKTEYSKLCEYEINCLINFSRGSKFKKEIINDNQLNLF